MRPRPTDRSPTQQGGAILASEPGKAAIVRAAQISAQVVGIDQATRTLTLKGPKGNAGDIVAGNEMTLNVQNPAQFKVVKKGDQVEVIYTEALALSVEPAPKPTAAKTK